MYRAIILPVLLYSCKSWFLTLWEEHRLRLFHNGMLKKIFGPKWDKVTGKWERMCNVELREFHFSLNIIWVIKARRMICMGYVACTGERRSVYGVLMIKPEAKRALERPRHRWEDNIETCLFQIWSLCSSQLYVISAVPLQLRE